MKNCQEPHLVKTVTKRADSFFTVLLLTLIPVIMKKRILLKFCSIKKIGLKSHPNAICQSTSKIHW